MRELRCVVVGPAGAGKSCMVSKYCLDQYPAAMAEDTTVLPPINKAVEISIDGKREIASVAIVDTGCDLMSDPRGPSEVSHTDAVLLCLDLSRPETLKTCKTSWVPWLDQHCPKSARLAVGLKLDKMKRNSDLPESDVLMSDVGCSAFAEVSSLTGEGLRGLFAEAAVAASEKQEREAKSTCCCCLLS